VDLILLLSMVSANQFLINATYSLIASSYGISVYALEDDGAYGYMGVIGDSRSGQFGGILVMNKTVLVGTYGGTLGGRFVGEFRAIARLKPIQLPNKATLGRAGGVGAVAMSPVPVVLREMVFNKYSINGTLINDLGGVSILSTKPPLTVQLAQGVNCRGYIVDVNFTEPTVYLPMPYVVNTEAPLSTVTANVTVVSTDPQTQVELVEPGDLLVTVDPVDEVRFNVTTCDITEESAPGPRVFANQYLGPVGFELPWGLVTTRLSLHAGDAYALVDSLFSELMSDRFGLTQSPRSPAAVLTEGTGAPVDYVALAVYVLRNEGVPARIALGLMGRPLGPGYYEFDPTNGVPWVEAYLPNGWVGFMPIPTRGGFIVGSGLLSAVGFSLLVGLVVSLPWIIGYYLYLYISRRSE
jgi:hypothetical protein